MKEITGNFWDEATKGYDAIVCTTNGVVKNDGRLVMGAGIAKDFRDRFQDLDLEWGQRHSAMIDANPGYWPKVMITPNRWNFLKGKVGYLIAFPTKFDWRRDSDFELIDASFDSLNQIASAFDWDGVLMTRPGCGLGGLLWEGKHDREIQNLAIKTIAEIYGEHLTIISNE